MIPESMLEPDEQQIVGYCTHCGDEILEGADIFRIQDDIIHDECFDEWAKEYFDAEREVARRAG